MRIEANLCGNDGCGGRTGGGSFLGSVQGAAL